MTDERRQSEQQLRFLEQLIAQHARIAGDIVAIDARTWALHGTSWVDGDVIMAEFDRWEEAKAVLDRLTPDVPADAYPGAGASWRYDSHG